MLYNMAARVLLMMGEGVDFGSAAWWVLIRIPDNLQDYYWVKVHEEVCKAIGVPYATN